MSETLLILFAKMVGIFVSGVLSLFVWLLGRADDCADAGHGTMFCNSGTSPWNFVFYASLACCLTTVIIQRDMSMRFAGPVYLASAGFMAFYFVNFVQRYIWLEPPYELLAFTAVLALFLLLSSVGFLAALRRHKAWENYR